MRVKIEYEQIVIRGEKKVRILSVKALRQEELPQTYLEERPAIRLYGNDRILLRHEYGFTMSSDSACLKVGDIRDITDFNEKICYIKEAGKRLAEINRKLAVENSGWQDDVIHSIEI